MKRAIALLCLLALTCSLCACRREQTMGEAITLYVFVDDSLSIAEAKAIGPKLSQMEELQSVTFVSAQEAFDNFRQDLSDSSVFDNMDSDMLRDRFLVTAITDNEEALIRAIEAIPGVAEVNNPLSFITSFK